MSTHTRCEREWLVDGPYPDAVRCMNSTRWIVVLKHEEQGPFAPKGRSLWRLCKEHTAEMLTFLAENGDPGTTVHKMIDTRKAAA